ncbi:FAD-dependent oxidoreductase [Hyphomonas johnsonii]|uniref:Monooxygenase FAD-binding protein n=1 Tax=Hyphomonas johnsonii MHS-2 TaxID=1280950 RepID=A0A059FBD7_9PROT|nr:NAD(P)/FAD-dependent oxidoreductase [Hyphomonas johnsonii]KCZ87907.1 monooxygenase FAD-binding protein [Hyphomonas johnsonii MHS-2]
MKKSAQVLVIGAGPVGTVAAYKLAESGIDVMLVEANPDCPEDLRASTLHPPTLEMLEAMGIFQEIDAMGLRAPVYQYRDRKSGETFEFDLGELSDLTPFPFRMQCEQFKLSRLLAGRLAAHPRAQVRFGEHVVSMEQDDDGVTVNVETQGGEAAYRVEYVIGCDGAGSVARKQIGIGFGGFTYPEKFVTYSTTAPLESYLPGLAQVNYVADPDEWMVLLRVPSVWRVLVPAPDADDQSLVSDARTSDVFERLTGDGSIRTEHRTIYNVHQRVAEQYFRGRVILAGDAAHLNNPLGGFGMNSGIHDAWNLCEKLTSVLLANAEAPALLAQYERQRRSVMLSFVQEQTIRNKRQLENKDPEARKAYVNDLRAILLDDERRRAYLKGQSMITSYGQERAIA